MVALRKLFRFFWHLQPLALRRLEVAVAEIGLTRPIPEGRPLEKGDIVVCGMLGSATGLGQGARRMLEVFRQRGFAAHGANASQIIRREDFAAGPLWPQRASTGGIAIVHINPDIWAWVCQAVGRGRFARRRVVGMWAWELETTPPKWRRAVRIVDEIWAPSLFVAEAVRKIAGGKPVHAVPYYLDVASVRTAPRCDPLPDCAGKVVVFFGYDVRSSHARKNPEAVVEAFRRAAADNPGAVLVIKMGNAPAWPEAEARVREAAAGLPNFVLLCETVSDDEMQDLMARVDIVVSLHRSEGFGLLMVNAMAAGKPVIATGWSGNLDFMAPDCSVLVDYTPVPAIDPQGIYDRLGAVWAEPDIGQAAAALKELLADPAARRRMGAAARAHVARQFSPEAWLKTLPPSFWASLSADEGEIRP